MMEPEILKGVGFVGLAGEPNVGKSTLVNRLVGQKISIVSDRPNTTRQKICGIYTDARLQAVFVDLPGLLEPGDKLNEVLMDNARFGLKGCDVIWHLRDARGASEKFDQFSVEMIRETGLPVWLIWNKIDKARGTQGPDGREPLSYDKRFSISARTGNGLDCLLDELAEHLPEGPLLFDRDQVTDRDMRFLAAELVREQLFRHLGREVPYATATFTESFEEDRPDKIMIRIVIMTERKAHKPILIGQGGRMLKKIGQSARLEIERMTGRPVYLDLWVKVRPGWRRDELRLMELGLKNA
jgi:GTP-binding protein Era